MLQQAPVSLDRLTYDDPTSDAGHWFKMTVRTQPRERYRVIPNPTTFSVRFTSDSPREAAYLAACRRIRDHNAAGIDPGVWPPSKIDEFIEGALG